MKKKFVQRIWIDKNILEYAKIDKCRDQDDVLDMIFVEFEKSILAVVFDRNMCVTFVASRELRFTVFYRNIRLQSDVNNLIGATDMQITINTEDIYICELTEIAEFTTEETCTVGVVLGKNISSDLLERYTFIPVYNEDDNQEVVDEE